MSTSEILDHLEVCGVCWHVGGAFPYNVGAAELTLVQRCICHSSLHLRIAWPSFAFRASAAVPVLRRRAARIRLMLVGVVLLAVQPACPGREQGRRASRRAGRPPLAHARHRPFGSRVPRADRRDRAPTHRQFDRMPVVEGWVHDVVRTNIRETGLREDGRLPIRAYLDAAHSINRNARFDCRLARLVEPGETTGATNGH
jgi:hypothetical protein